MRKDPNHKAWSHTPHDHSYKRLFAHPQMMTDLLLGFAPKALLTHLQLNTLELINKSFVSDDLRTRESDLIWRVRLADHWLYVLLLEFQSTIDPMMAVRIMGYLALLYQDLEKQQRKNTPVENGKTAPKHLPPVLPIVIYSGEKPWNAALNVRNLLDPHTPKSLHRFCPETHYLLLFFAPGPRRHHPPPPLFQLPAKLRAGTV